MTAQLIDGKKIALELQQEIAAEVSKLKNDHSIIPALAVILVGGDPASEVYVRNKKIAATTIGMHSIDCSLPKDVSEAELIAKIEEFNRDPNIHGILVQLPLPAHIDSRKVIFAIDYRKDVDGFHVINVGKLSIGEVSGPDAALIPCTPLGSLHLLKQLYGNKSLAGLKALVIGSSNIVGRPLARLLMLEGCTVTIANRSTKDLKAECLQSDVIFAATGVVNLIKQDMVNSQSIVIDIGINRISDKDGKTKIVGDIDFESVKNVAKAITPVPGGVGPMTIAYLLKNTVECAKKLNGIII
jgi:methylenetetrahydrofolate dehydrogenase (NADP+)/methenyltetrahydrofolate cyclohydrolase